MKAAKRDGGAGDDGVPFVPTHEWLDAYLTHATDELIEVAERYASKQAIKVGLVRHVDASYSEELVQDVLSDTMIGVIAWDPDRVSLKKHVFDAIKSRTRHAYVHGTKFRSLRLDVSQMALEEAETALAERQRQSEEVSRLTARVLDALWALAEDDPEVLLILSAHRELVLKKHDIMAMTKLSSKQYEAARKRLSRLTSKLPASLRDEVIGRDP